jgi:hypothetical protein
MVLTVGGVDGTISEFRNLWIFRIGDFVNIDVL